MYWERGAPTGFSWAPSFHAYSDTWCGAPHSHSHTAVHENFHMSGGAEEMKLIPNILQYKDDPEKSLLCTVKGSLGKCKGERDLF